MKRCLSRWTTVWPRLSRWTIENQVFITVDHGMTTPTTVDHQKSNVYHGRPTVWQQEFPPNPKVFFKIKLRRADIEYYSPKKMEPSLRVKSRESLLGVSTGNHCSVKCRSVAELEWKIVLGGRPCDIKTGFLKIIELCQNPKCAPPARALPPTTKGVSTSDLNTIHHSYVYIYIYIYTSVRRVIPEIPRCLRKIR